MLLIQSTSDPLTDVRFMTVITVTLLSLLCHGGYPRPLHWESILENILNINYSKHTDFGILKLKVAAYANVACV